MKIQTIQLLRGYAAVIVVLYHAHGLITKRASEFGAEHIFWLSENPFVKIGVVGVDIFFVLSGFIIFYASRNSSNLVLYAKKRIVRIYPIWFVAIFFMVVIALIPGTSAVFDLQHILYSALLVPHYYDGRLVPFLPIGWTLNYEILFYTLFGATLLITKTKRLELITGSIFFLWLISSYLDSRLAIFKLLENPVLFEFVIGGWLARVYLLGWTVSKKHMLIIVTFALLWLSIFFLSDWLWKLPSLIARAPIAISLFAIAVFYMPIRESKVHPVFIYLGDASYSIYLFHMFPIMVLSGVVSKLTIPFLNEIPVLVSWLLITFTSVVFGCLTYSIIEKRLNRYLKGYIK
ncbi:acyltransferase [Paraglaciecola sp.]|uniref:acyltransferase family protein n=1 Tax=Paraglaciecola sp. TaxID=1920173 RepID=UPI0032642BB0